MSDPSYRHDPLVRALRDTYAPGTEPDRHDGWDAARFTRAIRSLSLEERAALCGFEKVVKEYDKAGRLVALAGKSPWRSPPLWVALPEEGAEQ